MARDISKEMNGPLVALCVLKGMVPMLRIVMYEMRVCLVSDP